MNFKKFQSKWKIVKHFTSLKQRVTFRKLFSLPLTQPHQIKCYYVFRKKNSYIYIYRYIQKYTDICFQSISKMEFLGLKKWCSANVFSDNKQKHVSWKIFKVRKVFGCIARTYHFQCQVSRGSYKWVMFSERNCVVKWAIFFPSFCWLWDFLLENLKLKRNSEYVRWYIWANIKKLYARNNIFKK